MELFHQQQVGAQYLRYRGSGQLWMGCRTGKTRTWIEGQIDKDSREIDCPCLILGPLTVLPGWITELVEMGIDRNRIVLVRGNYSQKRSLLRSVKHDIFLLNYDVCEQLDVLNVRKVLGLKDWKTIAFDESYCLANFDANRTAYFLGGKRPKKHRYDRPIPYGLPVPAYQRRAALSGLPAPESELNYVSQYFITDGHFMGYTNLEQYIKDNWTYSKWEYDWIMKHPNHRQAIWDYVQSNSYCVTMEEADPNYKGLFFNVWDIPASKEQKELFKWLETVNTYYYPGEDPKTDTKIMIAAVKFAFGMAIAAGVHPLTKERIKCSKYEYLVEWYKLKKQPTVILSRSVTALKFLAEDLETAGIPFRMVWSDTDIMNRENYRVDFQNGVVDLFLAQSGVVQMGFNLSRSDVIFYLTNDWSNNVRSQANQRATIFGKGKAVSIIDLCIEGTRERALVSTLSDKYDKAVEFISENISFWKESC